MGRRTPEYPTGQNANIGRTIKAVRDRLKVARSRTIAALSALVGLQVNFQSTIEPTTLSEFNNASKRIVETALETTDEDQNNLLFWWFNREIEQPYRQGVIEQTTEANKELNALALGGMLTLLTPDQVLASKLYRDSLQLIYQRNFNLLRGFSDDLVKNIMLHVMDESQKGTPLRDIVKSVEQTFDAFDSRMQRIIVTEINKAYNDARLNTINMVNDLLGVELKVQHISALLPTTRATHSARHKKFFTVEEQLTWWNSGSNRISCHCSIRSSLDA